MKKVQLAYRTDVYVIVDLDKKIIEKVVVDDEFLRYLGDAAALDENGNPVSDHDGFPDIVHDAQEIADDEATEWPVWSFGW